MQQKLTQKQEAFAQAVVGGMNQSDAYRHAYDAGRMLPATIWVKASVVAGDDKVAARIQELRQATQAAVAANRVWNTERLIEEAETNLNLGRTLGQLAPANGALRLIGEATGLLRDQAPDTGIQITKVTVILAAGVQVPESRILDTGY